MFLGVGDILFPGSDNGFTGVFIQDLFTYFLCVFNILFRNLLKKK